MSQDKTTFLYLFLEFFVCVYYCNFRITIIQCFLVDISLNFFEQVLNISFNALASDSFFFKCIATHYLHCIVFKITSTHNQTNRYTFQFIICKFEAWTFIICIIILNRNT